MLNATKADELRLFCPRSF